jgi:hypothetical protein
MKLKVGDTVVFTGWRPNTSHGTLTVGAKCKVVLVGEHLIQVESPETGHICTLFTSEYRRVGKMTRREFIAYLRSETACDDSLDWIAANPGLTPKQLWENCPQINWMYWILDGLEVKRPSTETWYNATADIRAKFHARSEAISRHLYSSDFSRVRARTALNFRDLRDKARLYASLVKWEDVEEAIRG